MPGKPVGLQLMPPTAMAGQEANNGPSDLVPGSYKVVLTAAVPAQDHCQPC